jgi:hypothetical protein
MMRQSITRSARQLAQPTRLFSTSVRTMAEGDLGAPKSGGGGYAFIAIHEIRTDGIQGLVQQA